MPGSKIGIRIADGSFFPVLQEGEQARKKLVLTTVNPDQESVKIDLYRTDPAAPAESSFIGNLTITGIAPRPAGEPEIELKMGLNEAGELEASACDRESGEHQSIALALGGLSAPSSAVDFEVGGGLEDLPDIDSGLGDEAFDSGSSASADITQFGDASSFDVPDLAEDAPSGEDMPSGEDEPFSIPDMDSDEDDADKATLRAEESTGLLGRKPVAAAPRAEAREAPRGATRVAASRTVVEDEEVAAPKERYRSPRKERKAWLLPVIIAAAILLLVGGTFLVVALARGPAPAVAAAKADDSAAKAAEAKAAAEKAAADAKAKADAEARARAEADKAAADAKAAKEKADKEAAAKAAKAPITKTVKHLIRWGDTLWDLAQEYYGNPWLYRKIAKANKIRNPDLIICGNILKISPP